MTAVYAFVFGRTFSTYYGPSKFHYMAALFTGLAVMNYFSTSTFQALQSVVSNGTLLNKMRIPSIVFPISTVIANSFQLVLGTLPVLLVIAIVVGHNPIWMAFIVFPLFALACLSLGFGLALSALYVFFRDIPYLYELAYFAIFVTTPVFYPLQIIDPKYRPIIEYNPLSLVVEQIREIVVRGGTPSVPAIALALLAGFVALGLGTLLFSRASRMFMDYL